MKHFESDRTAGGLGKQQTPPEVCIRLVFRCPVFPSLGALESLSASTGAPLPTS